MAKTYTKIQYEYRFPNLPIDNYDIQDLYNSVMPKILNFAKLMIILPLKTDITIPELFISDEIITKKFKIHNYDYILKLINSFREKYQDSDFTPILTDIRGIIKYRDESNSIKELPCLAEELEEIINKSKPSAERNAAKRIASNLKSSKKDVPLLGIYSPNNNKITLYINSIVDYYQNAPNSDFRTQIIAGLEIVFAHELFHAIHFNLMGKTHTQQKKWWNCKSKDKEAQESVIEGLARWFEYAWCNYCYNHNSNSFAKPVYEWCLQETRKELNDYTYPDWPYAAARAFIINGKPNIDNAHKVFHLSLNQYAEHWHDSYELLKHLDPHNNNSQPISSTINSNPKLIFLTNHNQLTTEF